MTQEKQVNPLSKEQSHYQTQMYTLIYHTETLILSLVGSCDKLQQQLAPKSTLKDGLVQAF